MAALPLLVFDTNILLDVWLGRDGDQAVLLVRLAETGKIELVVPEFVLLEFRGTALRWVRDERERLNTNVRRAANEWGRSGLLSADAESMRKAASGIEATLDSLVERVDTVISNIKQVAAVPPHTQAVHFKGELRFIAGHPPDGPADGLKDCRIYEAVLEVARNDAANQRAKFLVTKDADFDVKELIGELGSLGFTIRKDPGRLYGELK
jgi:predicted nucleic acid-binding protein